MGNLAHIAVRTYVSSYSLVGGFLGGDFGCTCVFPNRVGVNVQQAVYSR